MDPRLYGLFVAENRRRTEKKRIIRSRCTYLVRLHLATTANSMCRCFVDNQVLSIDMLPDDVLLAIFDFCAVYDTIPRGPQSSESTSPPPPYDLALTNT